MRHGATEQEIQRVVAVIRDMGYEASPLPGAQRTAVGLVGNDYACGSGFVESRTL